MIRLTELRLPLNHPEDALRAAVLARLGIGDAALQAMHVFRRGYDARKPQAIMLVYTLDCEVADEAALLARHAGDQRIGPAPDTGYRFVARAPEGIRRPVVVGTGPCGFMAALLLAQMGFRPLVLERGKVVRERTKDTWGLWRRGVLNPESNVQYGEGGAGTFSDGKLYSQIRDPRHYGRKVLAEFVKAGAPEEILYVSKPHIGTFRLVSMVEHIRAEIEALGGEYRFGARVDDLIIEAGTDGTRRLRGLVLQDGEVIEADHAILALGHSARDSFAMLQARGIAMQAKPFSIGVRIEHPQGMIDRARFGANAGNPLLGAADYKLVTNGMSQYSRAERNANAGMVVAISPDDYPGDVLSGIDYQRHWESAAFAAGGGDYRAPAQLVSDFLAGRPSTALGDVLPSYKPGVTPTDLARCLPDFAVEAMREALLAFDQQLSGFARPDAVMTGVETRTSSPIRIPRGFDFQSVNTVGLFPAGEGAGYAGGILSAGVDGIRVAEALALTLTGQPIPRDMSRGAESGMTYG